MTSLELREKRAGLINQARAVQDRKEAEKRELTTEEVEMFTRLMDEADGLKTHFEGLERLEAAESDLDEPRGAVAGAGDVDDGDGSGENRNGTSGDLETRSMAAYGGYLRTGLSADYRALQADSQEAGGFLVSPTTFVNTLIKAIDDNVDIRQLATKFQVGKAESLGAPSLDADPEDGTWSTEIKAVDPDTAMNFGKRELTPHPLVKLLKVSMKLLDLSQMDVAGLVAERLGYKFGITEEKAFLTGDGAQKPLGVFTASTLGISIDRDVSTDNTTTAFTVDGLKNAKYFLKGGYWAKAWWLFHRDAIKELSKLKDGEGRYLWSESVRAGEPDTLLGLPIRVNENVPNTFTTGLYVGILGDFSNYWIADQMNFAIQRVNELYAETNQVGFIARAAVDGMPVLEEAFVRVKLA